MEDEAIGEEPQIKNKLSVEETEKFESVEDGWTFVTKAGKHLTK